MREGRGVSGAVGLGSLIAVFRAAGDARVQLLRLELDGPMEIQDKIEISELLARSAFGLDAKDLQLLEGCFTEQAKFTLIIQGVAEVSLFEGRDEIMGLFEGALEAQTDERKHVVSNIWYEQEGEDAAVVVSYLSLFATENGETNLITTGVYKDRVEKVSGNWLVADRNLQLDRPY